MTRCVSRAEIHLSPLSKELRRLFRLDEMVLVVAEQVAALFSSPDPGRSLPSYDIPRLIAVSISKRFLPRQVDNLNISCSRRT